MVQHNGWTNYQTWCYSIWINTDYDFRNNLIEQAEQASSSDELADLLKDSLQESMPEELEGVYLDLLQSAINSINFREIPESLLSK